MSLGSIFAAFDPVKPVATTFRGSIRRIATTGHGGSHRCDVILHGETEARSFELPNLPPALTLTREGDEIEVGMDEDGKAVSFLNVSTGLDAKRGR